MKKMLLEFASQMKAGQEAMENKLAANHEALEAIASSQETLKSGQGEVKAAQEKLQEGQEKLKSELKEQMLEAHNILREEVISEIESCKVKLEKQMKDEVGQVKVEVGSVKEEVGGVKEEIGRLETRLKALENDQLKPTKFSPAFHTQVPLSGDNETNISTAVSGNQPHPVLKIGTYDGKSSWNVFKQQFETISEYNKWNDASKAVHLTAALRGEAANVLETIPEGSDSKYQELVKALELRFGEEQRKDFNMWQLKTRQQKPDESLQELASDIERLVLLSYKDCPADARERIAVQQFMDSIRNLDLKNVLRMSLSEFKDLRSATTYALKIQSAQEASRMERRMVRQVELSSTETDAPDYVKEIKSDVQRLEMMIERALQLRRGNPRKIKCWSYDEEGHLRNRCPKLSGEMNSSAQQLNE